MQESVTRPHVIFPAIGFPPAAKSSAYRLREIANQFCAHGWDVTVVTIKHESWEREYGLDHTLSDAVDPRVEIVQVPLVREDLETDLRLFSRERALDPSGWLADRRDEQMRIFPEPVFGGWRPALEDAVLALHAERPADLLFASCAPYTLLAVARRLWDEHRVPYAMDYRDGWSVDVIGGGEAFPPESRPGRIEREVLSDALTVSFVNDPIADFYRERYPDLADRVRVVRNGFDEDSIPERIENPDPARGLTFGYLGSVNFSTAFLRSVLDAWRSAREQDDLLDRSVFEIRGHFGAGSTRGTNAHVEIIRQAEPDGVVYGGPVPKSEVQSTFMGWDVLVLMLVGGRYVTSGKVYEFMATGLPIVSAHEVDHDASIQLEGHPMWTGAHGLRHDALVEAFRSAAAMAVDADDDTRAAVQRHAARFERGAQIEPLVRELTELVVARRGAEV